MTTVLLNVRFEDSAGRVVKTVRCPEIHGVKPGTVRGTLVCDDAEEPFTLNVPNSSTATTFDVNYRPRNQVIKEYSAAKIRGSDRIADKVKLTSRSPIPNQLEVLLDGRSEFFCRPATW